VCRRTAARIAAPGASKRVRRTAEDAQRARNAAQRGRAMLIRRKQRARVGRLGSAHARLGCSARPGADRANAPSWNDEEACQPCPAPPAPPPRRARSPSQRWARPSQATAPAQPQDPRRNPTSRRHGARPARCPPQ
jgi:hypothetical protein